MLYSLEYVSERGYLYKHFPDLVPRAGDANEAFAFACSLVDGVVEQGTSIDERIQRSSPRWRVGRMSVIDRNILRLAAFEIFHRPDVPPKVVINEAVELAKRFGAEQTRSFVNGILQQICLDNEVALGG